jgi:raw score 3.54
LHNDIPKEWFEGIQCKLEKMGNNLFSIHISDDIFKDYKTLEHISSSSSYYRLLIPKLINQARVLYLDADIIVNGSLSDFYYSDLNGAAVGVVKDYGMGENFPFPYLDASVSKKYFNSGVLLIDCVTWRNEGLVDTLLQTVEEYGDQVLYGDQCILNIVLREKAKYYSFTENAQVQYIEKIKREHGITKVNLNVPPLIIHYAAKHKPWDNHNPTLFEREKYWFFRHLDWSYLIDSTE